MAEAPDSEPVASSSKSSVPAEAQEDEGPAPKKRKTVAEGEEIEKLEHRLGGILCCAVCLDLPQAAVYQCSNGHLMCAPCFMHLLADARLRDESATCPNCRVEISKTSASRNLAVEKTVSELPSECRHCARVYPRHSLQHHEENVCDDRAHPYRFSQTVVERAPLGAVSGLVRIVARLYWLLLSALGGSYRCERPAAAAKRRRVRRLTGCRYACLGCGWRGAARAAAAHEEACAHPRQSAADLVELLAQRERLNGERLQLHTQLLDLLSVEKITFTDLQLKPYRTEELHKLYYETSRFSAFGHQWLVKAFVNKHQRDPTQSSQREITYQLILKSKPPAPLGVSWTWVRGPWGEARVAPALAAHAFREDEAAPARALPLADAADANRLLSNKAIHFRLIMFLSAK
ncbi:zinc finger TRAF-type-containing protein 1 homolog isoform X1 [Bicyclus anynana]|uniref:Zinc finger TRAF-type-containing protein 1 homolog isoform X1 n=1 Tax=Bicyclus anynana TaxID=110368 RepID=A0A6J1MRX2_BICAN|nr:zinc finger TRAF-type-containing protein 1 homolog isoform X1 [Bicyclus anynana]